VLVGEDTASATYVRMKRKACEELGIRSIGREIPANISQADLMALVTELNADPAVNGILVQLPLPRHLNEEAILNAIALEKDVDGFHPVNIGRLAMKGRDPLFIPCTPYGVMVLLEKSGVKVSGADAVIVGRSNIVGLPVAMLLQKANATVTICHSRTRDLAGHIRQADILIAAIGQAEMITGDMIKPGATVIDVGTNRKDDPSRKRGYRLVGDVDFESAKEVAGAITPVPGGVGPMTIAMLMKNTYHAAELALKI
jgi:5,10-methylene-tetrahydrofolate dehydrogenase/methenyl tetrahydrofolate cyclohydrolase